MVKWRPGKQFARPLDQSDIDNTSIAKKTLMILGYNASKGRVDTAD